MHKRVGALLLTGGAAMALALSGTAAFATNATWTVKPGGTITSTAGTTTLTDTATGNQLKCTSSSATATLKKGSGLSGTGLGSITKLSFSGCIALGSIPATVTLNNLPYKLNATSFKSGTTTGSITGIDSKVVAGPCTVTVDGSGSTPNHTGKVKVTYTNSTHKLKVVASGGNLHLFNATGCSPFLNSGDATTFVGTYTVKPGQTITSP
jgi:hypothetical protein